ncbi:MAG: hypothetical protein AAF826_01425 [Pseudomonadota bacterium]
MRFWSVLGVSLGSAAFAGAPVVENVTVVELSNKLRFNVTISHADEGWDHYADGWGVYAPDGRELGYRVLAHPHVEEQPFTRSLTINRPEGLSSVIIRPRDSVHGEGADYTVPLP